MIDSFGPPMPRNEFYCQCRLRKPVEGKEDTYTWMTSWLPSDIAKKGRRVKLKEWPSDKEWSENWEVLSVGPKREGSLVEAAEDDYKHQREQSDI